MMAVVFSFTYTERICVEVAASLSVIHPADAEAAEME